MRQDPVIAVGPEEKAHHGLQAVDRLGASDPAPRDADDDRHHAKAAAAGSYHLWAVLRADVAALACQAAQGMGEVPEVAESLPLHDVEQCVVVQIDRA
jgi:hypothetical protein